jgi:hypothetical protein
LSLGTRFGTADREEQGMRIPAGRSSPAKASAPIGQRRVGSPPSRRRQGERTRCGGDGCGGGSPAGLFGPGGAHLWVGGGYWRSRRGLAAEVPCVTLLDLYLVIIGPISTGV